MADNGEDGKEHDAEDETNSDDETGETEDGGRKWKVTHILYFLQGSKTDCVCALYWAIEPRT